MNREAAASGEAHTAYRTPTHDQIAREAHQLWLQAGRPGARRWITGSRQIWGRDGCICVAAAYLTGRVRKVPADTTGSPSSRRMRRDPAIRV